MTSTLPASSRSFRGSRPRAAAHQRPSGRSHSTRTDRSTITSPTPRSRTQISPGIHGAQRLTTDHNHSPPPFTEAPVQISDSQPTAVDDARSSSKVSTAAAQHARSLRHDCVRRVPGAHRRRRLADRVYDDTGSGAPTWPRPAFVEQRQRRCASRRSGPAWRLRTSAGSQPAPRSGAARRFDGIAIRLLTSASQCCAPVRPPG